MLIFSLLPSISFPFDPSVSQVSLLLPTVVSFQQQSTSNCSENAAGVEDL